MNRLFRPLVLQTLLLTSLPLATALHAQTLSAEPVVMLSDIHFDPFHDPAKFQQLNAAPVAEWAAILDSPASATQAADFAALQTACHARGVDTPIALLESSLAAVHQQQPKPLFVTVSGDLMAHLFDCRFQQLAPKLTAADYSAFAAKTIAFVSMSLRRTYPGVPIYIALGNNDSGCKDYREDPNSKYLQDDAKSFADDVLNPASQAALLKEFSALGDYNVALPKPLDHTRLIVLQDIFESKRYKSCSGGDTADPATQQIAWLRAQLTAARKAHQQVWIMAHIPPGIDAYSTFTKPRNVCGGDTPEMFLASEALANTIADFPGTIALALFAHTHMDEFRIYKSARSAAGDIIPGKLVPSISPVNGNSPAFTVALVTPATATLKDYTVYSASTASIGDDRWSAATTWAPEYTFSSTYGLDNLSGASLDKLISGFLSDKTGSAPLSLTYQRFYYAGDSGADAPGKAMVKAAAMKLVWPGYACSMANASSADFHACLCPATP